MDSPSGRVPGEFNWGATLWHEMSHVFILSATNYRVPRWFTEGLAVHEEGQVNPEWSNRITPEVVAAIKAKKLLPVTQMDQGFIFPEYPEQVIVSYWQAGTTLDYIYEHWGEDAILGMVHSYAEVKTTPEAIEANLHVTPEEFDTQYMAWLMQKVGTRVERFDKWREQLKAFVELSKAKDLDGTALAKALVEIIQMYPEYVGDANAYEFLAKAQLAKKDDKGAAETLNAYVSEGGENPDALKQLASLQEEAGDKKAAAATLERLNFIYPEDEGLHRKLGGLWLAQGYNAGAVREYQAVLAMKPLDVASAEFDLAKAYFAAGNKAKAEDSVLASLEAAPGFKDAQKLLLEIEAGKAGQDSNAVPNQPK
jgi:Tfp pilus assembly protein PilF